MTENESHGNAGKKQKGQCDISLSHACCRSFFQNNSRHGDGGGADRLIQNAIVGKNVEKAVFSRDQMKMKHKTRSIRSRALSKEEVHFHLFMALAFHDLPRKKSDQLARLLGAILKR